LETALNDLSASARDSELGFPTFETESPPLLVADEELVVAGLKRPAQAFGFNQALGGGLMAFVSSVTSSSELETSGLFSISSTSATAFGGCDCSRLFAVGVFGGSRAIVFGKAGMIGTAGNADFVGL
jgi:hypothetical protein